jgi:WD40 repeat protein
MEIFHITNTQVSCNINLYIVKTDKESTWTSQVIQNAHENGVTSICWGPAFHPISFCSTENKSTTAPLRFLSGGMDNKLKVWTKSNDGFSSTVIINYNHWVRDVTWLNYLGNSHDTIAACSESGIANIFIYIENKWEVVLEKNFSVPVWNVSWSNCGTHLAISTADNKVYLYKQAINSKWELLSKIDETGQTIEENTNIKH